jgi:hypothetical protein
MTDEPVEIIYAPDRMRRIVIFRLPSGSYGYREERYYKNDVAGTERWGSLGGRSCHYQDLETAKREVVENVTWLASSKDSKSCFEAEDRGGTGRS